MNHARRLNLRRLLKPRHVAVIGGREAETVAGECSRIGYRGQVWPVNPRRESIGGHRCFRSVEDLPEPPDAAFVAVPREVAVDTVARLSAMGAGGAVCHTAGFAETGGEGARLEAALVEAAGDLALFGPNCYGVINYLDRARPVAVRARGLVPGLRGRNRHSERHALVRSHHEPALRAVRVHGLDREPVGGDPGRLCRCFRRVARGAGDRPSHRGDSGCRRILGGRAQGGGRRYPGGRAEDRSVGDRGAPGRQPHRRVVRRRRPLPGPVRPPRRHPGLRPRPASWKR